MITRFAIERLLNADYEVASQSIFYEIEKNYFQFDVRKNVADIVLTNGDKRVVFKYEPIYINKIRAVNTSAIVAAIAGDDPLTPDLAIEVYHQYTSICAGLW